MIRGTTSTDSTMLHYQERIEAWLRCEKVIRSDFFEEADVVIRAGDTEYSGRVQLRSMHPTEDIVHCAITGEVLGGMNDRWMMVVFDPLQDEGFKILAPEEDLDAICVKTEILDRPVSTPPEVSKKE